MATQIELLKKYGLSVRGHLGQHLLIDPNTQRKIVDLLDCGPGDVILEIGPGLGALTSEVLRRGAKVIAVEMDTRFVEILKTELAEYGDRFELHHADALKFDFEKTLPRKNKTTSVKMVANLPYYITAPLLFRIAELRDRFSVAVLMMQKEVAARLMASPGTKDYGRLTFFMRYSGEIEHAFDVKPSCFTPRPEVDSTVVKILFYPASKRLPLKEEVFVFKLIEAAFAQRRKTLLNQLTRDLETGTDRAGLEKILQQMGFPPTVRGEELLLKDYIDLAARLQQKKAHA